MIGSSMRYSINKRQFREYAPITAFPGVFRLVRKVAPP